MNSIVGAGLVSARFLINVRAGTSSAPTVLLLTLLLFASFSIARAQDELPPPPPAPTPKPTPYVPKDSDYDIVRVNSNLVIVPVSVTDAATGQPVLGLGIKDFRLDEEGRPQEITQIGDPEQVPLEIAILLDISASVNARIDFEKEAAARFLKQVLKPTDRATVFTISIIPRMELQRASADDAAAKLKSIQIAKGPTAFFDTVVEAARYLAASTPPQHRRVIVVISDGEDNYSERIKAAIGDTAESQRSASQQTQALAYSRAQSAVEREVQRAEAVFYSINPSGQGLRLNVISQRAQDGMARLANATGGNSFVPERLEDLEAVFRQIASELRSQYLLQYYSNDQTQNTNFRRIQVTTPARPNLRVRARQGYYPKSK
ncbi:MAG: VWA domain-containing protein [Pyrinomonadaceae bacterium]|nr:VWA domain-containing protein [Pyrinomonadaceae bacterium]